MDTIRANFLRRPLHTEDGAVDLSIKYVPEYAGLTVELFQAFALHCESEVCNPYVEISLITDSNRTVAGTLNRTRIVPNTKYPIFRDRKRGKELYEIYSMWLDGYRDAARLLIAVKHSLSMEYGEDDDLLGCFSFDLDHIEKYCGQEWYLILPKEIGVSRNLRSSDLLRYMSLLAPPTSSTALNNQLKTPDDRLMTSKIKSLKNPLTSPSAREQLNFDRGSMVHGCEFDSYEHSANYVMDDCYATLNNQLTTPDRERMTPRIRSLKNQLAPPSARKQLNFDHGSMVPGYDFDSNEHLANYPVYYQGRYATLNNQLMTLEHERPTPMIKSLKNQLAPSSARKRLNFSDASWLHGTGTGEYEHLARKTFDDRRYYATLSSPRTPERFQQLNDRSFTPNHNHSFNIWYETPTDSNASSRYYYEDIDTPSTEDRLSFTSNETPQSPQYESILEISAVGNICVNLSPTFGLFPKPSKRQSNKTRKITYIPSSVERKPKTSLFSRAKKEKCVKTSLTRTSQVEEEQKSVEMKSSQVISSFKRGKLRSSFSKLKHRITRKNHQSIKKTSPNTSPLMKPQHRCDENENLYRSCDKSSLGKRFLSKCRNRLQSLTPF